MKNLILISGQMRSGKNQFAEYLQRELEKVGTVNTDLFARSLKDWCKKDFYDLSIILNNIAEEIKVIANILFDAEHKTHPSKNTILKKIEEITNKLKIKDYNWYEEKTEITRTILQLVGTNIFRKRVDNDWWPKQTLKRVLESQSDYIIITDCRFPNEITVFTDRMFKYEDINVITIRINRKNINTNKGNISSHESEIALNDWKEWNYIVDNNGTLDDLNDSAIKVVSDILQISKPEEILLIRQGVL